MFGVGLFDEFVEGIGLFEWECYVSCIVIYGFVVVESFLEEVWVEYDDVFVYCERGCWVGSIFNYNFYGFIEWVFVEWDDLLVKV